MRDRLEEHITKNRDLLDAYDHPGDLLWQRIDKQMRPRHSWIKKTSRWAAAVVMLAAASWWGIAELASPAMPMASTEHPQEQAMQDPEALAPELAQIESYYVSVINTQKDQLQRFREEGIELDPELAESIDKLQQMYEALRKELVYGEDKDAVIEAMVKNLMTQMEILQQQLKILEKIKKARDEREMQV